jgi:hypothetical protein
LVHYMDKMWHTSLLHALILMSTTWCKSIIWSMIMQGTLYFSFRGIQMRFHSITRDSHCINPRHSPSLLLNKRKRTGVLFLIGQQGAELEMKLADLNSHRRYRHHLYLRCTMWSGSWPCRHLSSPLGISLVGGTPRNHTNPVDQDGMRPMTWHGRITHPTPREYHHPFIHDSLLRTNES